MVSPQPVRRSGRLQGKDAEPVADFQVAELATADSALLYLLGLLLVTLGTAGFFALEDRNYAEFVADKEIPGHEMTLVDALYMSVVTLTSVGFGDLCPTNPASKFFTVVLAILGLGLFGAVTDKMSAWRSALPDQGVVGFAVNLAVVVGFGSLAFVIIEGWELSDAIYFTVITSTTIGYGDHPNFETETGKLTFVLYIISSLGVMSQAIDIIGGALTKLVGEDSLGVASLGGLLLALVRNCGLICALSRRRALTFTSRCTLQGTVVFSVIEPTTEAPIDALYLSAMTLSTVGYGDIVPTTIPSKAFGIVYALVGLSFFCGPVLDATASWHGKLPQEGLAGLVVLLIAIIVPGTLSRGPLCH
jgi:hypothetical protein